MYTLDYKFPFSTIALICKAGYIVKIHFNFTYVSFLSPGVDWTNPFGRNVSGEFITGTRAQTHAHAHTHAHARACACTRRQADARTTQILSRWKNEFGKGQHTHIYTHTHFGVKT